MIELNLNEENSQASILEGGPSTMTGLPKHFCLETLLRTVPRYVIKGLDIAKIRLKKEKNTETFESPVILLYDRKNEKEAICFRRDNHFKKINYEVYNYNPETDLVYL